VRSAARSERSYGADLIEAGLNEGAGRFALAPLWALFTSLGLCLGVDGLKRVGC
jgi:hypothetical protein